MSPGANLRGRQSGLEKICEGGGGGNRKFYGGGGGTGVQITGKGAIWRYGLDCEQYAFMIAFKLCLCYECCVCFFVCVFFCVRLCCV